MGKILVAYATAAGSTGEIAEAIGNALREAGDTVDVRRAKEVTGLSGYDAVVFGSGVRAGKTYAEAATFLEKYQATLSSLPVAGFIVCLTMKENTAENCAQATAYLDALAASAPGVKLVGKGLFAGQVDYNKLSWLLKFILKRFIKEPGGDYRDFEAIRSWAASIRSALVGE
ncbi:MAG: flavodoxin domain-containing protein [Anaerolineae bacterium]|nr:flavodoxin domain-containing protein [Anaerolineae bacterium]